MLAPDARVGLFKGGGVEASKALLGGLCFWGTTSPCALLPHHVWYKCSLFHLCTLHIPHQISTDLAGALVNRGRVILILNLQMEKPRLREVKGLAQGHTASEWLSRDWPQGLLGKDRAFSRIFISLSDSLPFKGNWEFLLPLPSSFSSVPWHG